MLSNNTSVNIRHSVYVVSATPDPPQRIIPARGKKRKNLSEKRAKEASTERRAPLHIYRTADVYGMHIAHPTIHSHVAWGDTTEQKITNSSSLMRLEV